MQPSILTGFHHLILEPSGTGVGIGSLADAWSKLPSALAKAGEKKKQKIVTLKIRGGRQILFPYKKLLEVYLPRKLLVFC